MYLIDNLLSAVVPLSWNAEFPICVIVPEIAVISGSPLAVETAEKEPAPSSTYIVSPVPKADLSVVENSMSAVVAFRRFLAWTTPMTFPRNNEVSPVFVLIAGSAAYNLLPTAGLFPEANVNSAYTRFDFLSVVFGGRSNPSSLLLEKFVGSLMSAYESKVVGVSPAKAPDRSVFSTSDKPCIFSNFSQIEFYCW